MSTNNGRPLPWHDTATCDDVRCRGPMVPAGSTERVYPGERIACAMCGHGRIGSPVDVAKTIRAAKAWELYEAGIIHTDRGCVRCNGPLPLDRLRLCAGCVERDNAERQATLF
jgi:hypothetical protein